MTLKTTINIAVMGDIHLGHRRNSSESISNHILNCFSNEEETSKLDLILLEGDVFDNSIDLSDESVPFIDQTFAKLFRLAKKHDITIVILEGTPSHDWKQSQRLISLNEEVGQIYADVRYVKNLSIEYIEHLDINVLCVPDEWNVSTGKTLEEVKELMASKGLTQVDFSLMHGNFRYQLPGHLTKVPCHDEQEYLNLTRHLIMIGHNHTKSSYDRIYATGSLDRLSHGQEEPKGHYRFTVEPNGEYLANFIENTDARYYKTIVIDDELSVEESLEYIKNKSHNWPFDSCVRISARHDHPIFANMSQLTLISSGFNWTKLPISKEVEAITVSEQEQEDTYLPITITRDNVVQLFIDRIDQQSIESGIRLESIKTIEECL